MLSKGTKFCHTEAAFGDIDFKLFIKKQKNSERSFDLPYLLAEEIQTEKPTSRRRV